MDPTPEQQAVLDQGDAIRAQLDPTYEARKALAGLDPDQRAAVANETVALTAAEAREHEIRSLMATHGVTREVAVMNLDFRATANNARENGGWRGFPPL